jgi:pyruvate dehydrogenase phosphatase
MSIQPPLSRNVRDDITVHVIFFGVDASEAAKELNAAAAQYQSVMGGKH